MNGKATNGYKRDEIGCRVDPDASFSLERHDTIESVHGICKDTWARSRVAAATLGIDDVVHGKPRGALPMQWV